ncbi:hypothetical protein Gohar_004378 [Gossypium harknessii]|uniref:EB1 C-terminal domain-containing protein n=1 Tax=Gossypium harknessii TaxID=34285 RepID=A0A7J9H4Z6_9ROSI|nr:hypothetical protein [Gossypium harknessii]
MRLLGLHQSAMAAYEEQKERDFYFSKLRDTEILCQTPKIEDSPIVAAIKRILYATDEDDGAETLSPIEEKAILETQNRKKILNIDVDAAGSTTY